MATKSKFHTQDGIKTLGNAEIDGSLTVTGNFTVNGEQTIIDSTTQSVTDSMIELASGNTTSDTLDVGIYGNYNDGLSGEGDVSEYTGLFRDATDSTWKLYDGLEVEPTTTVNTSGSGFTLADLQVGDLTATTLTATNSITGASISYPTTDGTNGQVIKTNGSGTLTFGDIPAGYADSDVESYLSGGTGVTYSSGAISIGQAVATSDSPTFTDMTLSGTDSIKVPSGTTGQRNGTPVNGMFRYNSTNSEFEGYQNGAWGAIAGGDGGIGGMLQNSYTGDGSTVAFTLSSNPQTENNTQVYIDGVYQNKSTYSTSGTTLTFDTAPENSAEIEVIMFDQTTVDTGSVTTTAIADNAVTIDKLALSDGTTGQFIKTDGSGTMSFASVPAGYTDSDVGTYLSSNGYATQSTVVAAITDSAPATLDTLNELAAALGDDANFSTTVTNSIALKAPLARPVFSGTVDMGTFGNRTRAFEAYGSNVLFDGGSDSMDLIIGDGSSAYMSIQTTDTASAMKIRDYSGNADLVTIERATGETTLERKGSGGSGVLKALNINHAGTSVNDGAKISFTAGTSTEGAGISSTGQALNSADLRFYAGGNTERMRIDSSGNVGIGQTSPNSNSVFTSLSLGGTSGKSGLTEYKYSNDASKGYLYAQSTAISLESAGTNLIRFASNGAFRGAIDSKGTLFFGNGDSSYAHNTYAHAAVFTKNSTPAGTVVIEDSDVSSGIGNTVLRLFLRDQDPATHANFISFGDGGGSVGSVTHNDDGGGVSFNTTSDYRLKENINYTWDATTLLKQLKPAKYNFITNPSKTVQGLLAHEVSDLVPSSVRGDKDHMMEIGTITDSDGDIVSEGVYEHFCKTDEGQTWTQTGTEPLYQQLDYSRLVPLLTKAMQEQQTLIESLTTRLETLENA